MANADGVDGTARFTGLAEIYARSRPSYPSEAIDFIIAHCSLKAGDLIADIGCGTGISSRLFAERSLSVVGIEPNEEMRKQAEAFGAAVGGISPIYRRRPKRPIWPGKVWMLSFALNHSIGSIPS